MISQLCSMCRSEFQLYMDEADMRVWLHCVHSNCTRIVIFSPDTDIYHIGLAIAGNMHGKSIIIQLSKSTMELDLNEHAVVDGDGEEPLKMKQLLVSLD